MSFAVFKEYQTVFKVLNMKIKIRNPTRLDRSRTKIKEMEIIMNRITLKAATIFSLLTIVAAFLFQQLAMLPQ